MLIHPDTKFMFSMLDNPDSWIHEHVLRDFRNQVIRHIKTHYPVNDDDRQEFENHSEYPC